MTSSIATWTSIATLLVIIFGATVALLNLRTVIRNQRETTAKNTFRDFLKICVEKPEMAYGRPPRGKQDEYEWFVGYFLWAAEEILKYSPKGDWRKNMLQHANYHRVYLKNDERFRREDYDAYPPEVQTLIDEACREQSGSAP